LSEESIQTNPDPVEETLRIEFERSGGFTGIPVRVNLQGGTLDRDELREIRRLIDRAGFFTLAWQEHENFRQGPDQFFYRISVTLADQVRSVSIFEQQVPEALRPLIRFLVVKAREQKE
jgi:hypothetical protein